jgi:hypothetical protein
VFFSGRQHGSVSALAAGARRIAPPVLKSAASTAATLLILSLRPFSPATLENPTHGPPVIERSKPARSHRSARRIDACERALTACRRMCGFDPIPLPSRNAAEARVRDAVANAASNCNAWSLESYDVNCDEFPCLLCAPESTDLASLALPSLACDELLSISSGRLHGRESASGSFRLCLLVDWGVGPDASAMRLDERVDALFSHPDSPP